MPDADSLSGNRTVARWDTGHHTMGHSTTGHSDPADASDDDDYCWVCGGPVIERHCKIICPRCGFTRDCSDP